MTHWTIPELNLRIEKLPEDKPLMTHVTFRVCNHWAAISKDRDKHASAPTLYISWSNNSQSGAHGKKHTPELRPGTRSRQLIEGLLKLPAGWVGVLGLDRGKVIEYIETCRYNEEMAEAKDAIRQLDSAMDILGIKYTAHQRRRVQQVLRHTSKVLK